MIDPLTFALPVYVILMVAEMVAGRVWRRARYEVRDTAASLAMGAGAAFISTLGASAVILGSFALAERASPISLPVNAATIVACLVLSDLAYYWSHRLSHERRWLLASHVVHHSSQHYNYSTALRSPWTDVASLSFLAWLPLCLIGFDAELVFLCRGFVVVWQFWFHTEALKRLGPLERILVTPSHHRVHHAVNPVYLDRNYGAVLIVWDHMFGTFTRERLDEPPRYGVVRPIAAFNPIVIAFHEWADMFRDIVAARSLNEAVRAALLSPGSLKARENSTREEEGNAP